MHGVDDVGFDDPDETFGDIDGVIDAEVPEISVETVISRRQDRGRGQRDVEVRC